MQVCVKKDNIILQAIQKKKALSQILSDRVCLLIFFINVSTRILGVLSISQFLWNKLNQIIQY